MSPIRAKLFREVKAVIKELRWARGWWTTCAVVGLGSATPAALAQFSDYVPVDAEGAEKALIGKPTPHADETGGPPGALRVEGPDPDDNEVSVEEITPFENYSNNLTFGAFLVNNVSANGVGRTYYTALGARYALKLGSQILLSDNSRQDSFWMEGGVFYYKVSDFTAGTGDTYQIVPVVGTLRYTVSFRSFGFFLYGGMMYNAIMGASGATPDVRTDAIHRLGKTCPAGGFGLLFELGPGWQTRVDLGYDTIGAGLMLRF